MVGGDVDVSDISQEFATSSQLHSSMPLHSPDPVRFVPSPWLNSHTPQSSYSPYARPAGFGSGIHVSLFSRKRQNKSSALLSLDGESGESSQIAHRSAHDAEDGCPEPAVVVPMLINRSLNDWNVFLRILVHLTRNFARLRYHCRILQS